MIFDLFYSEKGKVSKLSGIPVLNCPSQYAMYGAPFGKKTIRSVNHVFRAYLNHSLSYICIRNILGYLCVRQIVLQVGPKYTGKISQTRFFPNGAPHAIWKKRFCDPCFLSLFRL